MKKHTCADCGKKFASENAVASHKKAKHPDHSSLRQKREEKEEAKKEMKEAGLLRLAAREEERKTQKLIKEAEENYRRFGERGVFELTCAEYFAKSLKRLLKNKLLRGAGNEDKCFFPMCIRPLPVSTLSTATTQQVSWRKRCRATRSWKVCGSSTKTVLVKKESLSWQECYRATLR